MPGRPARAKMAAQVRPKDAAMPSLPEYDGLDATDLGRFGDEATLPRLAAQLEQAQPWTGRRPPLS